MFSSVFFILGFCLVWDKFSLARQVRVDHTLVNGGAGLCHTQVFRLGSGGFGGIFLLFY